MNASRIITAAALASCAWAFVVNPVAHLVGRAGAVSTITGKINHATL